LKEFLGSLFFVFGCLVLRSVSEKNDSIFLRMLPFPTKFGSLEYAVTKIDSVFSKKYPLRNLTKNKKFKNKLLADKENGCKMVEISENGQ